MHDATFVSEEDRVEDFHATVFEAIQTARDAKAKSLVLYHFSTRYQNQEIQKEIKTSIEKTGFDAPVYYVNPYTFPNTRIRRFEESRPRKNA